MIEYRTFRNCDPPGIAEVWRSQPPLPGLAQPVSSVMLDAMVLAKPQFDPAGLIIATEGEQIVGFAHGSFAVNDEGSALDTSLGTTSLVMVRPRSDHDEIARELFARSEAYLRERGAKLLYCGEIHPLNSFYLGLYGGSEMPGVLESDAQFRGWAADCGYEEIDRVMVFQRDLSQFRPAIDRNQLQIRRNHTVQATFDPPATSWWDACLFGRVERTRFDLSPRNDSEAVATVTFWDLEPLASSWGVSAVGLVDLATVASQRRQGLATFIIGEALRQLHAHGVNRCQVQAMASNAGAIALYQKLGFEEVDQGVVLRKRA